MSETPKRRSTSTNTRSGKKLKVEAGVKTEVKAKTGPEAKSDVKIIDLTGKKATALKIEGTMDLERVQAQFKEALQMATISSECVWKFMGEKANECTTLKQQLENRDKVIKDLEQDLAKSKSDLAKMAKKVENHAIELEKQAAEFEKKMKIRSDTITKNARMSTLRSIAGVKVQMDLEAQSSGMILPEEWDLEKLDKEYVRLGGASKLEKQVEEPVNESTIDDTYKDIIKTGQETVRDAQALDEALGKDETDKDETQVEEEVQKGDETA